MTGKTLILLWKTITGSVTRTEHMVLITYCRFCTHSFVHCTYASSDLKCIKSKRIGTPTTYEKSFYPWITAVNIYHFFSSGFEAYLSHDAKTGFIVKRGEQRYPGILKDSHTVLPSSDRVYCVSTVSNIIQHSDKC